MLSQYMEPRNAKWLLIGDFNQIENPSHKLGGRREIKGAKIFTQWRLQNNLIELTSKGVSFTWTNNREGENLIMERLDRAFCNSQWKGDHLNALLTNLPIFLSDHSPLILQSKPPTIRRKRPYKLESWCLQMTEIQQKIDSIWNNNRMHGFRAVQTAKKIG